MIIKLKQSKLKLKEYNIPVIPNSYFIELAEANEALREIAKELEKKAKKSLSWGLIFLIIVNFISYFTPIALAFGAYTLIGITLIWKYFYLSEKMNDFIFIF